MLKRIFAAVCLATVFVAPSFALDEARVTAIKSATETLVELGKDSQTTGLPPRATTPAVEALLATVLTTTEIERENAVPFAEINRINDWNFSVVKVLQVYILAGTASIPENARGAKVDENTVTFMPEVGRSFDAMLWVQAAMLDTIQTFLTSATPQQLDNPNVKSGLGKIRSGAAQTLNGTLKVLVLKGITDEWREARMRAIIALVPRTAKIVAPEDRRILQGLATEVAGQMKSAKLKTTLEQVAAALN